MATNFGCFCHCKDTNFLANHNFYEVLLFCKIVVSATAKILIF